MTPAPAGRRRARRPGPVRGTSAGVEPGGPPVPVALAPLPGQIGGDLSIQPAPGTPVLLELLVIAGLRLLPAPPQGAPPNEQERPSRGALRGGAAQRRRR